MPVEARQVWSGAMNLEAGLVVEQLSGTFALASGGFNERHVSIRILGFLNCNRMTF